MWCTAGAAPQKALWLAHHCGASGSASTLPWPYSGTTVRRGLLLGWDTDPGLSAESLSKNVSGSAAVSRPLPALSHLLPGSRRSHLRAETLCRQRPSADAHSAPTGRWPSAQTMERGRGPPRRDPDEPAGFLGRNPPACSVSRQELLGTRGQGWAETSHPG